MTKPITFGIIGGGWRAEFYLRIAQELPERFQIAGCVAKTEATRARIMARWNLRVFDNIETLLNQHPGFVVTSVPWAASGPLLVELASQNMPVLAETPPASDLEGLNQLWKNLPSNPRVQVAEQYAFQPLHAARLAFAHSGKLGDIRQVQISVAHGYHGIALIRKFLNIGYENAVIRAFEFKSPLIAGPDRSGPPSEERKIESNQIIAYLQFGDKLRSLISRWINIFLGSVPTVCWFAENWEKSTILMRVILATSVLRSGFDLREMMQAKPGI